MADIYIRYFCCSNKRIYPKSSFESNILGNEYADKKKIKTIQEVKEYPNDWFYMVKKNKNKEDEYWWWNKRTDAVSFEKPETFDREPSIFKVNISDSEDEDEDEDEQEIIRDYGEWKLMRTTYSPNNIREWWWNPTTEECQFEVPECIKENIV